MSECVHSFALPDYYHLRLLFIFMCLLKCVIHGVFSAVLVLLWWWWWLRLAIVDWIWWCGVVFVHGNLSALSSTMFDSKSVLLFFFSIFPLLPLHSFRIVYSSFALLNFYSSEFFFIHFKNYLQLEIFSRVVCRGVSVRSLTQKKMVKYK